MKIIAVDDEALLLERLTHCITEAAPDAEVASFRRPSEALAYAEKEEVDVAFLDIQMRGMNGLELGKKIKFLQPKCNVIFCTAYGDYIYDAVSKVRCNGYLLKPFETKDIANELDNLRLPVSYVKESKIYIQCFGNFEVYVDGKPLAFSSAKTKELLAYLVDRGSMCRNREIMAVLWDDDGNHESYLKKCRKDLQNALSAVHCEQVLLLQWGAMGINKEAVDCDYYQWKENKAEGINAYNGEYMAQFSWAETTNAGLLGY